jgi:hypothetical protein
MEKVKKWSDAEIAKIQKAVVTGKNIVEQGQQIRQQFEQQWVQRNAQHTALRGILSCLSLTMANALCNNRPCLLTNPVGPQLFGLTLVKPVFFCLLFSVFFG